MRGLRPGVRRCPWPRRTVRPAPQRPARGLSADAAGDTGLPPLRTAIPRAGDRTRPHPRGVSRRRGLLVLLPHALHDPGRVGGVVLRRRDGAALSGRLPVPFPGAPRPALGERIADVAHGHRRLPRVCGAGGGPAGRGVSRGSGPGPAAASRRRRPHHGRRHHTVVRLGGPRHAPRPGPATARRCHAGGEGGARGLPVLPQHHAPAHRHPAAAAGARGAGVVELPDAVVRGGRRPGAGQLRHEPAPTARRRRDVRGHPRRRGPCRPGPDPRPHGLRTPGLHPGVGGRPTAAARTGRPRDGVRGRLPRLGFPRGRLPVRGGGRRGAGVRW